MDFTPLNTKETMADNFTLSQEIIGPELYNDVVQELGANGHELLNAVQEDERVFAESSSLKQNVVKNPEDIIIMMYPAMYSSAQSVYSECLWNSFTNSATNISKIIKNEPTEYEDQKNFISWNQQYETYNDQQQQQQQQALLYGAQSLNAPIAQIPANVDYAGELDFDIIINSQTTNRNSWIYSPQLRKVFININNILPVDIVRNQTDMDLYLRSTMLYSLPQYAQDLVETCSTHNSLLFNRDVEPHVIKHVLRCTNPGSMYFGEPRLKEHLSVVTPLCQPQAGMDSVRVNYQFICKNSCPSGMNRRAVDVIFTLEDRFGKVLGRRKLAVRVCSCPKRDKEKEEKEFEDARGRPPHTRKRKATSTISKPKLENHPVSTKDEELYEISLLTVVGRSAAEAALVAARNQMTCNMYQGHLSDEAQQRTQECIDDINAKINNLISKN